MTPSASRTHQTLSNLAYELVRDAILNGKQQPGQPLKQTELASQLGISLSPLREALPRLEADGYITQIPRRGYIVAKLNPNQITEVFKLRQTLESKLARLAIAQRTEADIAAVFDLAAQMTKAAEESSDASQTIWFELNRKFHTALFLPAQRPHHLRALEYSSSLTEPYIRAETRLTGDLEEAQQEHLGLAQSFALKNTESFVDLTHAHSEHTRKRLLSRLQKANLLSHLERRPHETRDSY